MDNPDPRRLQLRGDHLSDRDHVFGFIQSPGRVGIVVKTRVVIEIAFGGVGVHEQYLRFGRVGDRDGGLAGEQIRNIQCKPAAVAHRDAVNKVAPRGQLLGQHCAAAGFLRDDRLWKRGKGRPRYAVFPFGRQGGRRRGRPGRLGSARGRRCAASPAAGSRSNRPLSASAPPSGCWIPTDSMASRPPHSSSAFRLSPPQTAARQAEAASTLKAARTARFVFFLHTASPLYIYAAKPAARPLYPACPIFPLLCGGGQFER